MKFKNPHKNTEIKALIEVLKKKGVVTDAEIKEEKVKINGKAKK